MREWDSGRAKQSLCETITVVSGLKIPSQEKTFGITRLVMPNSYPSDRIFNLYLTTIKDSYIFVWPLSQVCKETYLFFFHSIMDLCWFYALSAFHQFPLFQVWYMYVWGSTIQMTDVHQMTFEVWNLFPALIEKFVLRIMRYIWTRKNNAAGYKQQKNYNIRSQKVL